MGRLDISDTEKIIITTDCGAGQRCLPKPRNSCGPSLCYRETENLIVFQSDQNHSYKFVSQGSAIFFAFN